MIDTRTAAPASIARRLAEAPELWWPLVRRDTASRWYAKLLEGRHFEAWLLGWPVGEGIELHDHGQAAGALTVVEGCLLETSVDTAGRGRLGSRLLHRLLREGDLVAFGPDHIHDVVNGGHRPALSIHVYSPRLRSMTFYENRPDRGLAVVRTEVSRPELILV